MPLSLLDLFRALTTFTPERTALGDGVKDAPWEDFTEWAIVQGVAPLAAYNLEYRLAGAGVPRPIRERLLSVYQGSINDNVMKLVNFKRAVDDLEGRKVLLLGGASFAEAVYPHVAFRPVAELELWVRSEDLDPFTAFLGQHHFKPSQMGKPAAAARALSDGRTPIFLYSELLDRKRADAERQLIDRAIPMRVYGPSFFRPDLEDAILLAALMQAREGYDVPAISFIDLRELFLGAPALGGPYSRPVNFETLKARAKEWRVEKALYASAAIVETLFPETRATVSQARPALAAATRALIDRVVVHPWGSLGGPRPVRGADRLRRLLTGGR